MSVDTGYHGARVPADCAEYERWFIYRAELKLCPCVVLGGAAPGADWAKSTLMTFQFPHKTSHLSSYFISPWIWSWLLPRVSLQLWSLHHPALQQYLSAVTFLKYAVVLYFS